MQQNYCPSKLPECRVYGWTFNKPNFETVIIRIIQLDCSNSANSAKAVAVVTVVTNRAYMSYKMRRI